MNFINEIYGDICFKGYYCLQVSFYVIFCVEGIYNNWFGVNNIFICFLCIVGKYCFGTGRVLFNDDCDMGWYCVEGFIVFQTSGSQCLAGYMCFKGSFL